MRKLLTTFAASAALAVYASAGKACDFHDMQSTSMPTESVVAMSTPTASTPIVQETAAQQAAVTVCPADAKDCVPEKK
jgi:hypothetical protein